jgi:hypothetical protein
MFSKKIISEKRSVVRTCKIPTQNIFYKLHLFLLSVGTSICYNIFTQNGVVCDLSLMCMCFCIAIGVMDCVTCKIFFNIFAYSRLEIVGPLSYVLYFLKCKTIFPGKYCIKFACIL